MAINQKKAQKLLVIIPYRPKRKVSLTVNQHRLKEPEIILFPDNKRKRKKNAYN
jgi:hypothetical protein